MITISESSIRRRIVATAPSDWILDPYLFALNMTTSEHLKIYNKAIFGLPEKNRYDIKSSNWTVLY